MHGPKTFACVTPQSMHRHIKGHTDSVSSVSFHPCPDSHILASASDDGTVRIWDWKDIDARREGKELKKFEVNICFACNLTEQ